jgi:nickel-dependent lactate racemase
LDPVQDYNPNCRPGKIEGNPVIQDIIESASFLPPVYQIGLILNHKGDFIQICAGELVETYKKMCAEALKLFSININSEPEALLISAGGHPRDIDLLQAHKSLFEAEFILKKGGTIFFFAECPEAIGSANLETLLELKTVEKIRAYLQSKPIINGLSALSLMKLGQEYDVRIFSELSDRTLNVLNFKRLSNFNEVTENIAKTISADGKVYFIPWGALTMVNMLSCQRTEI